MILNLTFGLFLRLNTDPKSDLNFKNNIKSNKNPNINTEDKTYCIKFRFWFSADAEINRK